MGGYNGGQRSSKPCTSNMRALDVRRLARAGRLKPGQSFGWSWTRGSSVVASINICTGAGNVTLSYRNRTNEGEWKEMNYAVRLTWTPCNYGGERAWWLCPADGCGRRVAVLFGGKVFACRRCQRLVYASQRESENDRAIRRADTLRRQLGWVPGIAHGDGEKPKGMHWKTYNRMRMDYYAQSNRAFAGLAEQMGLTTARLASINPKTD